MLLVFVDMKAHLHGHWISFLVFFSRHVKLLLMWSRHGVPWTWVFVSFENASVG